MYIKVKGYLTFRRIMGDQACINIQSESVTIQELLQILALQFGSDFTDIVFDEGTRTVGTHIRILVNGRHYGTLPEKLETRVTQDDEICLFPPIAGG